jgi:hypothetical protein
MEFEQVYVVTTVPETHLNAVLEALANAGAGVIGHYTHCSFALAGTGRFKPDAEAQPALGTKEQINTEPEIRVETFCPRDRVRAVTAALRAAHPYEEPVIYLLPILNEADF